MNYSTEQIARVASVIMMIALLKGVDLTEVGITEDSLVVFITVGVTIIAQVYGYFRRYTKGDTNIAGKRK